MPNQNEYNLNTLSMTIALYRARGETQTPLFKKLVEARDDLLKRMNN